MSRTSVGAPGHGIDRKGILDDGEGNPYRPCTEPRDEVIPTASLALCTPIADGAPKPADRLGVCHQLIAQGLRPAGQVVNGSPPAVRVWFARTAANRDRI
jgi:hypothetical protein